MNTNRKLKTRKTTMEQGCAVAEIPRENVIFADDPNRKIQFTRIELKEQLRQMVELARGLGSADVSGEFAELREDMLVAVIEETSNILTDKGMAFDLRRKIPFCGAKLEKNNSRFRRHDDVIMVDDDRLSSPVHPHPDHLSEFKNELLLSKLRGLIATKEEAEQPIPIDITKDVQRKIAGKKENTQHELVNEIKMHDDSYSDETFASMVNTLPDINPEHIVSSKTLTEQFVKRSAASKKGWKTRRKNQS